MPKLSYDEEIAALEETVAAVRSRADVLHPLALEVTGELEEQIAEIKALKQKQQAHAEEGKAATAALNAAIARGTVAAREIRAYAGLVFRRNSARLAQVGVRARRRPRRKAADDSDAAPAES